MHWTAYVMPNGYAWQAKPITRGFTGHEQLDPVGLVHMNGRVYDPELGRFLSPDAVIQDVTNLQTINAYSYVLNNPLSLTDPTGFFFQGLFRAIGSAFKAAFRAIRSAFRAVLRSAIGRAIIQILACIPSPVSAATCAGAAAALTLSTGGSVLDAIKSAAFAFVQMGVWSGVHVVVEGMSILGKSLVHGVVGGALSVAQGGGFVQGLAANAIGALGGGLAEGIAPEIVSHTAIVSAAGCAAAAVAGGKCADGAVTAAFANIYNNFAGGMTAGAKVGATAGSPLGPGGAAIGAIGGGLIGGIGTYMLGNWLYDTFASAWAPADAASGNTQERILYHYTSQTGMEGILASEVIFASSKLNNPKDAAYGTGVYVSNIVPGTMTSTQLARQFLGQPFPANRFSHYIAVNTTGLAVVQGRPFVYVIPSPTGSALPVHGRIRGFGANQP